MQVNATSAHANGLRWSMHMALDHTRTTVIHVLNNIIHKYYEYIQHHKLRQICT